MKECLTVVSDNSYFLDKINYACLTLSLGCSIVWLLPAVLLLGSVWCVVCAGGLVAIQSYDIQIVDQGV